MSPQQIIIIRHCEKNTTDNVNLSPTGVIRANELPNFFLNKRPSKLKIPTELLCTRQIDNTTSNRPYQSIKPLSKALNLPIDNKCYHNEVQVIVDKIKKSPVSCVLVSWNHTDLVKIAQRFGVDVHFWGYNPTTDIADNPEMYDAIWVLNTNHKTFEIYKQFSIDESGNISYDNVKDKPVYKAIYR